MNNKIKIMNIAKRINTIMIINKTVILRIKKILLEIIIIFRRVTKKIQIIIKKNKHLIKIVLESSKQNILSIKDHLTIPFLIKAMYKQI
jgi:hypothetical protein